MQKQILEFAVKKENGVVTRIGMSSVYQPRIKFKSAADSIKWYQDRPRDGYIGQKPESRRR